MKQFNIMAKLIMLVFVAVSFTACGPAKHEIFEDIESNESAYVIPLEGDTTSQAMLNSADFLEKQKVATKRIYIPQKSVSTGRYWWNYKWVPTVKVIRVDRKPVTFHWSDAASGIKVESRDSIGFTVGIDISGFVSEPNTSNFLYHYPAGNMSSVLSNIVKSKSTEILSREFAKYDLEGETIINKDGTVTVVSFGAREMKGEIVEIVKNELLEFFKDSGVTITTFGLVGGLAYDDEEIQTAINDNFKSELEVKNKENARLGQEKVNAMKIGIAAAEKLAAQEFAAAAEDRKKMVALEVDLMNAQARLAWAKSWNGALSANIMGEGSSYLMQLK